MFEKYIIKEKSGNKTKLNYEQENNILFLNPGEKFNKLYSNFEVRNSSLNFFDGIDNKIKIPSKALDKFHQNLGYKNYQIIEDNNDNFKYQNNIRNIKHQRNRNIDDNFFNNSNSFNFIRNNKTNKIFKRNNYNLSLDENKIYDRLYNYGFYIKNKTIIKKIRNEEMFYKTMSKSKINTKSKQYIRNKNKYNLRLNKTQSDFHAEETFAPNINKNSIKIVNKLKKNKKMLNKKNNLNYTLNNNISKNKITISKTNLSNDYKNLFNYNHNLIYKKDNTIRKSNSQRILNLYEKGVEHYKKIAHEYNLKKERDFKENYKTLNNNNDDFKIEYNNKKIIKNVKYMKRI